MSALAAPVVCRDKKQARMPSGSVSRCKSSSGLGGGERLPSFASDAGPTGRCAERLPLCRSPIAGLAHGCDAAQAHGWNSTSYFALLARGGADLLGRTGGSGKPRGPGEAVESMVIGGIHNGERAASWDKRSVGPDSRRASTSAAVADQWRAHRARFADSLFERVEQVCRQSQIVAAYFFRNPNNAPAPAAPAEGR